MSQKKDLANFISMISRDETPFMSKVGSKKANAIYHEWLQDELEYSTSRRKKKQGFKKNQIR